MLGNYAVHVVLLSRDLAESRGFYHDKLGLEILEENCSSQARIVQ